MNHKKISSTTASIIAGFVLISAGAAPAFAQTASSTRLGGMRARTGANASTTAAREAQMVKNADNQIANRISALNALETRVNAMQKLSGTEKSSLSSQIQSQIATMTALQSQIATDESDNNTSSLKTDIQSITKAYRIYMLIIPQGTIAAAADRVMAIANAMTTLSGALQTRITQAQSAGAAMSASVSALADLNTKAADATTQAQNAVTATASLAPDNGSTAVMQANTAALKTDRTDIQTAQKDLAAARQDAVTIVAALKAAEKSTTP